MSHFGPDCVIRLVIMPLPGLEVHVPATIRAGTRNLIVQLNRFGVTKGGVFAPVSGLFVSQHRKADRHYIHDYMSRILNGSTAKEDT